jgi:hypothetical protein
MKQIIDSDDETHKNEEIKKQMPCIEIKAVDSDDEQVNSKVTKITSS